MKYTVSVMWELFFTEISSLEAASVIMMMVVVCAVCYIIKTVWCNGYMAFLQPAEIHLDVYLSKCINSVNNTVYKELHTTLAFLHLLTGKNTSNIVKNTSI